MAKKADRYFGVHPWCVSESGFNPRYALTAESVFSLANEFMGFRGFAEEGCAQGIPSMIGTYLNGVYELSGEETPGGYKGIVKQTHYMVNAANFLKLEILIDKERLLLDKKADSFLRTLDFTSGLLTRSYTMLLQGKQVFVRCERILSMDNPHLGAQRLTLKCEEGCDAEVHFIIDGAQRHYTSDNCLWRQLETFQEGEQAGLLMTTSTTDQKVLYRSQVSGSSAAFSDRVLHQKAVYHLTPGDEITREKSIRVDVFRSSEAFDYSQPGFASFDEILKGNQAHYEAFWKTADVQIKGDELNQQGIRYCIFHLHQTYRGFDEHNNIGAKGLTGEAYNGHAFWDTETYCLPYYLFNDPQAARHLLSFRYHTLVQARERAKQLDCQGACYPIATLNGKEACALWQHASLQMQPSTAVAFGIWHYAHVTGDKAFLFGQGKEILVDICRYLVTRGNWNQDRSAFGFYGVMGPDEFHLMVNNNFYTNFMAKQTLVFTLDTLEQSGDSQVSVEERETWRAIVRHMILIQREDKVLEQHEGYFSLPHQDIHAIPLNEFPLYEHWSYDRIYRTDMIKQPDVLMAMFLFPGSFTKEELRVNYDYYEPRCIHESSLSPSVHTILASDLGRCSEAERFFGFATRLDLDNYNRNTREGLHLTSIAAAWVTIVYGFGGLRTDGSLIQLKPFLPESWEEYSFNLRIKDSWIKLLVNREGSKVTLATGDPVSIVLAGQEVLVT